jgi:prepilin-type processing-associated H-X9-DG protein
MSTTPHPGVSPLEYQSPEFKKKKRPNWILRILVTLGLSACVISIMLPGLCKAREPANRAKCASNLHQIGLALSLYAGDNGGHYPESFDQLLRDEQLTSAVFVCPSSNDEAAAGDTQAAVITEMEKPHHLSYVYLGKGLTTATAKDDTVIAYELPDNHQGDGMNMLFGDGHAEWESIKAANELINKARAATQPVPNTSR